MKNPSFSLPEFFCSKSMMRLCPRRGKNCRQKKNKIVWIFNKINDLNIRLNWVNATRMKCEYSLCPSTQHNAIENKYIRFYLLTFVVLIDVWYVHASVSTTTLVFVRDVFVVSCTTRNRVKFEGCGTGFPFLASRKKKTDYYSGNQRGTCTKQRSQYRRKNVHLHYIKYICMSIALQNIIIIIILVEISN